MAKIDILDLDSIPIPRESVTIKEGLERLKEDHNDPEAQKFKKEFYDTVAEISARAEYLLEEIYDTPIQTVMVAKQLSKPENIFRISSIKGIDLARRIKNANGKYDTPRKIARLFLNTLRVDKFKIIKLIEPTVLDKNHKRKKLTTKDYLDGKKKYDEKIKNSFKYLKRVANQVGYTFKLHELEVEAIQLERKC